MAALVAHDAQRVAAVRRFNRFYTQHLGVLQDGWLRQPVLADRGARALRNHQRGSTTATDIGRDLGLDAGYLSRILRRFHKLGLIRKDVSPDDARQSFLSLTARGQQGLCTARNAGPSGEVGAMLGRLHPPEQDHLVAAMRAVETMIAPAPQAAERNHPAPAEARRSRLGGRPPRRALRAGIRLGGKFRGHLRADRRRLRQQVRSETRTLLDRRDGRPERRLRLSGQGFRDGRAAAPAAGRSDGARARARHAADRRMRSLRPRSAAIAGITLWTHSVLTAARHIYEQAGFRLTSSEKRKSFGQDVVSEYWDLKL